jgi:hypothetical protein
MEKIMSSSNPKGPGFWHARGRYPPPHPLFEKAQEAGVADRRGGEGGRFAPPRLRIYHTFHIDVQR